MITVATVAACGKIEAEQKAELPALSSFVTLDAPPGAGTGPLGAHVVRGRQVETVMLDEHASASTTALEWSASGRWLAYAAHNGEGAERMLWMRRHDAEDVVAPWREPILASSDAWSSLAHGKIIPSPTRDQFLVWNDWGQGTPIAVVTPHDDGTVGVNELYRILGPDDPVPSETADVAWSADGSRVVMSISRSGAPVRHVVHDIGPGRVGDGPWPARELAPPAGMVFDTGTPLSRRVSGDGRWASFEMRSQDGGPRVLVAVPLDGRGPPREVPGCTGDGSGNLPCAFGEWHPTESVVMVRRGTLQNPESVAWSPDAGVLMSLPGFEPKGWLGTRRRMLIRPEGASRRLAVVDVDAPASPVVTEVDGTALASFRRASVSPDGRWLLLEQADAGSTWLETVDLESTPPWTRREVVRTKRGEPRFNVEHWSPPGGTLLLLAQENVATNDPSLDHAVSVDLSTGRTTAITVKLATRPTGPNRGGWTWSNRIAPGGNALVVAHEGRLAVWHVGTPLMDLVSLESVSEWGTVRWPPPSPDR